MSMKSRERIFFLNVSGRGHRELAVQVAGMAAVVAGRSAVGTAGIAAMEVAAAALGAIVGVAMVGIKGTLLRAVAVGVMPICTGAGARAVAVVEVVAVWGKAMCEKGVAMLVCAGCWFAPACYSSGAGSLRSSWLQL